MLLSTEIGWEYRSGNDVVDMCGNGNHNTCIGSEAEWLVCWTQAQKVQGSNRSCDAVGQQS